jgi:hypothetical protein
VTGSRSSTTHRAVPAGHPGALLAVVGLGLLGVLLVGALRSFWAAGLALALLLVLCGAARLVLPVSALGPLAVRSRALDVLTCAVLAAGVGVLSVISPAGLLDWLGR